MSAGHTDSEIAVRVRRLEERVVAAGLTDDAELDGILERVVRASPRNGARIVARAWADDDFRRRLLADAGSAIGDVGLDMAGGLKVQNLGVVENTATEHHVLVCTLCSCYPIGLLGPSPSWYKSEAYRSRVVREPRAVLAEFGLELPDDAAARREARGMARDLSRHQTGPVPWRVVVVNAEGKRIGEAVSKAA